MSGRRMYVVARDEFRFSLRRPMVWILLLLVTLLVWGVSTGNVGIVIGSGDATVGGKKAFLTSEFAISQVLAALSFTFYIFFVSAAAGLSVIRDAEAGVLELLNATPLGPGEYAWAKFLGVLAAFVTVIAATVGLMILFLQVLPNPGMIDTRGPFHLANYVRPALYFAFPLVLFFAGIAFAVGTSTRKPALVFLLPIAILLISTFFLWQWSPAWLSDTWNRVLQAADPAGVRWLRETYLKVDRGADYYNTTPIGFDGLFLVNRAVAIAIGLWGAWFGARRLARATASAPMSPADVLRALETATANEAAVPRRAPESALASHRVEPGFWPTAWRIARVEGRELRSQPAMYLFLPLILVQVIANALTAIGAFDTPLLLVPGALAVSELQLLTTLVSLLLVFYGTESLTRERTTRMSAIVDSAPVSNGAIVLGKGMALAMIWAVIALLCLVASVVAMLVQGKVAISLTPFLLVWGLLLLPSYLVWTSFIFAVYALVQNRFTTYAIALMVFGLTAVLFFTGNLSWVMNWPLWGAIRWSDMSVFEFDRGALVRNRLFMLALTALFARIAIARYPRVDRDVTQALHALTLRAAWRAVRRNWAVVLPVLILGVSTWRLTEAGPEGARGEKAGKDYWKKNLATWRDAATPWLKHAELDVELQPAERKWTVKGSYLIVNQLDSVLRDIPFTVGMWDDMRFTLDGVPATPDTASHLYVFSPAAPLAPGDSLVIGFSYTGRQKGASKKGGGDGEFLLPSAAVMTGFGPRWFPLLGYVDGIGSDKDNAYEPRQYPVDWYKGKTPPVFGSQRPLTVRMAITAPDGFTANGVGERVSESVTGGKRTVVWQSDHPVMAFNIVGGRYAVKKGNGTALYYHPGHSYNIDEMSGALDAARQWYGEWFGAYPWKELKVSEFPALAGYAQGFPTNISFSEGIGFLTRSEPKTNLAFLVTAHESAHQWWGNMVTPGVGPSGNFLSEGLAHFSTALLIEQVKGKRNAMEFRKRIESRYSDQRHADAERKMFRVDGAKEGDNTLWYDKGGWVFWMLADRMGRENALRGMKDFVKTYFGNEDHPVLYDFAAHLRKFAPDTLGYDDFIRQWMDTVVVPEYRVQDVKTRQVASGGEWETTATIENAGTGRMPIEIAVTRGERYPDDTTKAVVAEQRYADARTTTTIGAKERQSVLLRSPFKPEKVVVDPDVRVLQLRRQSAEAKVKA